MGNITLPRELLLVLTELEGADKETQAEIFKEFNSLLFKFYIMKLRAMQDDTTLTQAELTQLNSVIPYNLDAWDGYGHSRELLLRSAASLGKNMVVLSGDSHNSWANELKMLDADNRPSIPVAVEFAGTSVSSPGIEAYAQLNDDATVMQFEKIITTLIDNLKYFNSNNRGFMTVTFNAEEAIAEWIYIDNLASQEYNIIASRYKKLKTLLGTHTIEEA